MLQQQARAGWQGVTCDEDAHFAALGLGLEAGDDLIDAIHHLSTQPARQPAAQEALRAGSHTKDVRWMVRNGHGAHGMHAECCGLCRLGTAAEAD